MAAAHRTPAFDGTVADQHRRIDAAEYEDLYVVGDVHGCLAELRALLAVLGVGSDDLVVFVGDLVRKGPDSAGVLRFVRDRPNCCSVRGNNEEKLLRGDRTLPALEDDDLEFLRSLPLAISWDGGLVTHAGVDPRLSMAEHGREELQGVRYVGDDTYWYDEYAGPPTVCFGHTVHADPVVREWAIGLDTGCVYGGGLTAYDWHAGEFVRVPSRDHRERPAHKFVEPANPEAVRT